MFLEMEIVPDYWVKDISLEADGRKLLEWAELSMPVVMKIRKKFEEEKPLKGYTLVGCLHITKETGVLARTLKAGGAKVVLTASNPLSTTDEVAAALAVEGINVYAIKGESNEDYYRCIGYALSHEADVTIDDGADLVSTLHKMARGEKGGEMDIVEGVLGERPDLIEKVIGGSEETTTGVIRLRAMARDGALKYPLVAVNDAKSKNLFDNPVGTGQSALDGVIRATDVLIAGKNVVVVGYGHVGLGIAERARGLGALVTVVDVQPHNALKAAMYGFRVATMREAAEYGDIFITATGNINVIRKEHFELMKNEAILANAGHFDVEISKPDLEELSENIREIRPLVTEYKLKNGKRLFLLGEGRLVNLACAKGHPSEVMDMSFALQALCAEYMVKNAGKLPVTVIDVPQDIDEKVARLKLETMDLKTEKLTEQQEEYLKSWKIGT
jgi:adenosylhomocysteinase